MINFLAFMLESLDKPWNLSPLDSKHPFHNDVKKALDHYSPDASHLKVYAAHDSKGDHKGYVIEYAHKDAYEIHHTDADGESGFMKPASKTNLGFAATMKDRISHHVNDKGRKVRVVATNKRLIDHYHTIAKAANVGNHHISEIMPHTHQDSSMLAFTIKPKPILEINVGTKQ